MDDNIFASIIENDKLVSKYRAAPPNLKQATANTPTYTPTTSVESRSQSPPAAQNEEPQSISSHISGNIPKYRICIDSVDKVVEGTMIKSSFIVYRITFTRMSDLQSHGTWKRYKDLSTWYAQLQQRQPELLNHETLKFPATQDTWMGGNQNDPLSEFVLKRKLDLETFLKSLFFEFPLLFKHPNIAEFFELNDLPEEKISKLASRIMVRELQESTRVNIASKASSTGISGIVLDNTGERALDISWYKYDKTILNNILNKDEVYNPNSAVIMHKNEAGELFSDSKNNITLAELLHFEEENERMIGAHQKLQDERCSRNMQCQEERNNTIKRTT